MYQCSICSREVIVNHIDKPVRSCDCVDGKIVASMSSKLEGFGELNATAPNDNNLTEQSMLMVRAMVIGVSAVEFFKEGKTSVFADNLFITDEATGRKFKFSVNGVEV